MTTDGENEVQTSHDDGALAEAQLRHDECPSSRALKLGTTPNNEGELKPKWDTPAETTNGTNFTLSDGLEVREFSFGKGVIATRRVLKGEMLFEDIPLAASQHFYSKKVVTACEGCMRTLGSLRTRLGKILQAQLQGPQFLETDYPDLALNPVLDDPLFSREGMRYERIVSCDCSKAPECRAVFCSDACMRERGHTHRLMSQGDWRAFEAYAAKKHESLRVGLMLLLTPRRDEVQGLYSPRWSQVENIGPEWRALRERIVEESYDMLLQGWVYDDIPLCSLEEWDREPYACEKFSQGMRCV